MVRRSALKSWQTSALTSSMISSILLVAWILLVTACSCFWNASRAPTSICAAACGLTTALIESLPAACSSLVCDSSAIYPDSQRNFGFLCAFFHSSQTPLEHPHLEASLREQKCGGGAAPAALAIRDVFLGTIEDCEHVAHFRERHVDCAGQLVVLILRGIAHIQP